MLWYGFIFYFISFFLFLFFYFFSQKIIFFNSLNKFSLVKKMNNVLLSFLIFFLFLTLLLIYSILDATSSIFIFLTQDGFFIINYTNNKLNFSWLNLSFNSLNIYLFPFIYIFLLITILSVLFCLNYNYGETILFSFYTSIILLFGTSLFFTNSMILFFLSYEMLLIPSFLILYKFAKTRRCVEASYLMFFWTQFGALFLIFSFLYLFIVCGFNSFENISFSVFSSFETNFLFVCWIIGFGVKFPIWPFYGWLPKAHVEASTNFFVKFAFFGFFKCLVTLQLEPTFYFVYPFLIIGITDSVFKLFYQIDLKKLVAYSTVVEMHWLTICVISGHSPLILASFCMLISHALLSTNSFLLVDAINRRFKTRLITEIAGLNLLCPKLFLIILANSLVFLGFPGSIFFIAEFIFFSYLFDLFPVLSILLLILLYLLGPTFFFRSWMNVMFGLSFRVLNKSTVDLLKIELVIFSFLIALMFWLGFTWQSFIF
uniref:NADH-ubiquinone oxidoreductase chain 4 n=1 Tax=Stylonychia lemnae TaxID=5949 RepID=A0A3Q8B968_STYLE|nr:Nad4 [Stylonychia lemnae]